MPDLYVYRTRTPRVLAAFRQSVEAMQAWTAELAESAAEIGTNDGPYATISPFDGTWDLHGLDPVQPVHGVVPEVPTGWRYVKSRGRLEPERGRAGIQAREWMSRHRQPDEAKTRRRLSELGLPTHALAGHRVLMPSIELMGGALWATCEVALPTCTWERVRVSDYWLCKEATQPEEQG
jgi:hypothetical protein